MSYCTISNVKNGGLWSVPVGITDDMITNTFIPLAEAIINKITNDNFNSNSLELEVDGSGSSTLWLYKSTKLKCISVSKIEYVESDGSIIETISENNYKVYNRKIALINDFEVRAAAFLSKGKWAAGSKNYLVTGLFGWSEVPALIERACILLTRLYAEQESTGSSSGALVYGIKSEKIGDYSYTKGSGGIIMNQNEEMTGIPEVDIILTSFDNNIIGIYDSGGCDVY